MMSDVGLALTETEPAHGCIKARKGGSFWDLKGYELLVVVRDLGDGRVQVHANAQTVTDNKVVDFGRSKSMMRRYLEALDARMREVAADMYSSAPLKTR